MCIIQEQCNLFGQVHRKADCNPPTIGQYSNLNAVITQTDKHPKNAKKRVFITDIYSFRMPAGKYTAFYPDHYQKVAFSGGERRQPAGTKALPHETQNEMGAPNQDSRFFMSFPNRIRRYGKESQTRHFVKGIEANPNP